MLSAADRSIGEEQPAIQEIWAVPRSTRAQGFEQVEVSVDDEGAQEP